jgi:hypothetical protein
MNEITLQIIKNNLPISDVCRTVAIDKVDKNGKVTTCEMDNPFAALWQSTRLTKMAK